MAFSSVEYTSDGVQVDFNVPFNYLDRDHIVVLVGGVQTTSVGSSYYFTWVNDITVRVRTVTGDNPVPGGNTVVVARQTPVDTPAVVFGGGTALTSENLNKNSEYLTFALQEATDDNDEFTTLYLGSKASGPTFDNSGDALKVGAIYFNTVDNTPYFWTGSVWTTLTESVLATAQAARDAALAAQTNAENSADAAQASANSALSSLDEFDDTYLGSKSSDPAVDNDGDPLITGAFYWNSPANQIRVFNGTVWQTLVAVNFNDLTDVDTSGATSGDGLVYNGSTWQPGPAGGGMFKGDNGTVGSRAGDIFRVNEQELNTNTTIDATENASCAGPLAIASGVTLTVTSGGSLVIL